MRRKIVSLLIALSVIGWGWVPPALAARSQIRIVGSSTVYPFTTTVAEHFGARSRFKAPVVDSTGTGGGMQNFCAGVGELFPDLTNASRRIKPSEFELCKKNGVIGIVEVKIGYDGVTIAHRKGSPNFDLSLRQLYLALGEQVPVNGVLVKNPYKRWSQISPDFPDTAIQFFGPPPTSGTRDSFVELALEAGAKTFPELMAIRDKDPKKFEAIARKVREDNAWTDSGENDNAIVQRLLTNPTAFGVFGHSFLEENLDRLQPVKVGNVDPSEETIGSGEYPLARSMFIYLKRQHVGIVPGLQQFLKLYTSTGIMGRNGVLSRKGLIPLRGEALLAQQKAAHDLLSMQPPEH